MNFKLTTLATALIVATGTVSAATTISSPNGYLSLNGNIEIDNDYIDNKTAVTNESGEVTGFEDPLSHYRKGGRVELNVEAQKELGDKYVKARGTLLLKTAGDTQTDDAWLEFGQLGGLGLRVGSFEALDVYPLGQDIIVDIARDTLSPFDAVYIYRANELRGRGGENFGQAMIFVPGGENVRLELAGMVGSNASFLTKYQLENFTAGELKADGDTLGLRPGIEYRTDTLRLAAVAELGFNSGTIENTETGQEILLSDRRGLGISGSWFGDGYTVNANVGYLDAKEVDAISVGLNAVIADFGIGYVYAINDNVPRDGKESDPHSNTIYASYAWNNLLGIEDLAMKVGAFYSKADDLSVVDGTVGIENTGARLRFNYAF